MNEPPPEWRKAREEVLNDLAATFGLVLLLTGAIKATVESFGDEFLTDKEDNALVEAHRMIWDAAKVAARAIPDIDDRAGADEQVLIAAGERLLDDIRARPK